jgi:hypothetical protein
MVRLGVSGFLGPIYPGIKGTYAVAKNEIPELWPATFSSQGKGNDEQ